MRVTPEEGRRILPHFNAYCESMRKLGDNAASALATLQQLQQVSRRGWAGRQERGGFGAHSGLVVAPCQPSSGCAAAAGSHATHAGSPLSLPLCVHVAFRAEKCTRPSPRSALQSVNKQLGMLGDASLR